MTDSCKRRFASRLFFCGAAILGALAGFGAHQAVQAQGETIVEQKSRAFVPEKLEIKAGTTVTFVNADPFGHNVYSETPGGEFDLGLQAAGQRGSRAFAKAGSYDIRCRVHPRMRLELVVK